jgi:hypothetical protein
MFDFKSSPLGVLEHSAASDRRPPQSQFNEASPADYSGLFAIHPLQVRAGRNQL